MVHSKNSLIYQHCLVLETEGNRRLTHHVVDLGYLSACVVCVCSVWCGVCVWCVKELVNGGWRKLKKTTLHSLNAVFQGEHTLQYGPVAVGDMDMERTIELYEHLQSLHVQVMGCSETPCTHIAHENKTRE